MDGSATLERDGRLEAVALNAPVVIGDRMRTSSGRLEILLPDGSALALDRDSTVELAGATLVRLEEGQAMLTVAGAADPSRAVRYRIDTPAASVQTDGPGEFRVAARSGAETELSVLRGYAFLTNEGGSIGVPAGERSVAFGGTAPARSQPFNSAQLDAFDRFVSARRDARVSGLSARYLPAELRPYGSDFDGHGSWRYDAQYGYIWYPSVDAGWQPYSRGYWDDVPSFGWTWIGSDAGSWPTHHYGRWGYAGATWFWIPGRAWAPAWVSWAAGADYISWCPLGIDGRPVSSLSGRIAGSRLGWTALPRPVFGHRESAVNGRDRYAVPADRLPRSTTLVALAKAPAAPRTDSRSNRPAAASAPVFRSAGTTPPTAPPPVIYYRGPALPPSPAPSASRPGRESGAPAPPAQQPGLRRAPGAAPPPAGAVQPSPRTAPPSAITALPSRTPPPPAQGAHGRGERSSGPRAVPRQGGAPSGGARSR